MKGGLARWSVGVLLQLGGQGLVIFRRRVMKEVSGQFGIGAQYQFGGGRRSVGVKSGLSGKKGPGKN